MQLVVLIFAIVCGLLMIASQLWLVANAFEDGVVWGLLCLFLPGATLVFVIRRWDVASRPFALWMGSAVGLVLTLVSGASAYRGSARPAAAASASAPAPALVACAPATATRDGFSKWCCNGVEWTLLADGNCASPFRPSSSCDDVTAGSTSTEVCTPDPTRSTTLQRPRGPARVRGR